MKTKSSGKTVLFNVRLPAELVASWKETARRTRMSQTEMATTAIRGYLMNPRLKKIAEIQDEMQKSFNSGFGLAQDHQLLAA